MRIVSRVLLSLSKATMASPAKKSKRVSMSLESPRSIPEDEVDSTAEKLQQRREDTAQSILKYKFNKNRVRIISEEESVPEDCKGIVYWMFRDCRVQDNWAFLFAQKLALKNEVPLHVCYCFVTEYLDIAYRQFHFQLMGLQRVATGCKRLNISFHLLKGSAPEVLPQWVADHGIGAVVCDFNPLRIPMGWLEEVKDKLKDDVPLIQVDAHNIVPCWVASDKQEYSARTIRGKINSKLDDYLTEFPPLIKHPHSSKIDPEPINWQEALKSVKGDKFVGQVKWAKPGYLNALKTMTTFIEQKLKTYATKRNNPTIDALSDLSPWFHSGHISVQRVALCVQEFKFKLTEGVNAYLEEAIVRRELADNFCFYCKHYDSVKGAYNWAQKTLEDHRKDKREYIYTLEQLEGAQTHDNLWNSVQCQLLKEGKPHGFLRMYWCKKILEWTPSAEVALKYAIYLNDHYCLDGADPNGYTGCMWSICGIHDQGWSERPVFGKIRYMNYAGCKRKFDINAYIARYGGKEHKYVPYKDTIESVNKDEPSVTKDVKEKEGVSVQKEEGIIKPLTSPTTSVELEASA